MRPLLKSILILIIFSFSLQKGFAHDFYVTITEINHNEKTKSLEISIKIFIDDFERMLEKTNQKKLKLEDSSENESSNKVIFDYIKNTFEMNQGGKKKNYDIIGKQIDRTEMYVFLEVQNIKNCKNIELINRVLMETFEAQINIVHFKYKDELKTLRLSKLIPKGEVSFE